MGNFRLHKRLDEMQLREVIKNFNASLHFEIKISVIGGEEAESVT